VASSRAVQVPDAGGDLSLIERDPAAPGPGHVRVKVAACGICHSDMFAKEGGFPGVSWPLVPGHEIAGTVDALGDGVQGWREGQRVGVGWFGGNCGWCDACRSGDLINCADLPIPGITMDGGYADHVIVRASALAAIPDEITDEDAAPLLCAGITTFNALRRSRARAGDLVAVLGVGGLGHLGVQYANKMGFETVAIARGTDKEDLARRCGAHHYVDSTAGDPAEALSALGGAAVILSTVTAADAMSAVLGGLGRRGQMVVVGATTDAIQAVPAAMIGTGLSIVAHASGTSKDSEDTLRFSALTGVRPMIETRPLEEAAEAYGRMASGEARFRMVLTT
jgi:D-arabinose 1-dehydrogenase-like Zn-dependent alcohol dehydrogenase